MNVQQQCVGVLKGVFNVLFMKTRCAFCFDKKWFTDFVVELFMVFDDEDC